MERSDSGVKGVNGRVVDCRERGWVEGKDVWREGRVEGGVSE